MIRYSLLATATVAMVSSMTWAQAPPNPRVEDELQPNTAYRRVRLVERGTVHGRGEIAFRVVADLWQGAQGPTGRELEECYVRVEVYGPDDPKLELKPLVVKSGEPMRVPLGTGQAFRRTETIPFAIPMLAHKDPYMVRVYLLSTHLPGKPVPANTLSMKTLKAVVD